MEYSLLLIPVEIFKLYFVSGSKNGNIFDVLNEIIPAMSEKLVKSEEDGNKNSPRNNTMFYVRKVQNGLLPAS